MRRYGMNDTLVSGDTGTYVIERVLQSTENSHIYSVDRVLQGKKDDSYKYFVKQQEISRESAERARKISNRLNQSVISEVGAPLELTLPVIEVFEFDGYMFSLMKYYDGGMFLEDMIAGQLAFMDTENIFELFEQLVRGAEKIHYLSGDTENGGVLHLDLHPGNIFCCNVDLDSEKGRLKTEGIRYIDFSNARSLGGAPRLEIEPECGMRAVRGYRAPELLKGKEGKIQVSRGTDIFSLTAILLFMLRKKAEPDYKMNDDTMYFYSDITLSDEAGESLGLDPITLNLLNRLLYTGLALEKQLRFNEDTRLYIKCFEDVFQCVRAFRHGRMDEVLEMGFRYSLSSMHSTYLPWERLKYLWPEQEEKPVLDMYKRAVRELAGKLLQPKVDNRNNSIQVYMFQILWDMYKRFEGKFVQKPDGETKALLSATGIAIYNNLGKATDAEECVSLWDKNKKSVSPEIVLFTATKIPGYYENILDFNRALEEAERNVQAQEQQNKALKSIMADCYDIRYEDGSEVTKSTIYAKSLSACGRYYSFMGKQDDAQTSFKKALEAFKSEDTMNIKRTEGYYLHWAIEFAKESMFKEMFLGDGGWNEVLKRLCRDVDGISGYDFLICVKGLHKFGMDALREPDGAAEEILDMFEKITNRGDIYSQHPWGLIYRHMGCIFMEVNKDTLKSWADKAFGLACRRMKDAGDDFAIETIMAYHSYFIWRNYYASNVSERSKAKQKWEELFEKMAHQPILKIFYGENIDAAHSIEAKLNVLNTLFRYEFA